MNILGKDKQSFIASKKYSGLEIAIDIVTNSYYFRTSLLQLRKDKEG